MDAGAEHNLHATVIAVGSRGILIRGASGMGKSDLALRCITMAPSALLPFPARLVADDRVLLTRDGLNVVARAPETLLGKLEVRGLGILTLDPEHEAKIALVVDIAADRSSLSRLPDPWPAVVLAGLALPLLRIAKDDISAPIKVLAALTMPNLPLPAEPS